jgi:acylphosphatase
MPAEAIVRLEARITGRVQGVYYRATTEREARARGVTGWVRNCRDGAVELLAEGPRSACTGLLDFCRTGPPGARVDDIQTVWSEATGEFRTFATRF